MYCGNLILRYGYPHGPDRLCAQLASLPQWQLDRFCVEILTLEDFYQRSVGRWATDMPWAFKGAKRRNFYQLSIRHELSMLMAVPGWNEIKEAQLGGQFNKNLLVQRIQQMSRECFAEFCAIILKLEHHYCVVHSMAFTDKVEDLELKDPGQHKYNFIFEVAGIERDACLWFSKLITDDQEEESNRLIEYE